MTIKQSGTDSAFFAITDNGGSTAATISALNSGTGPGVGTFSTSGVSLYAQSDSNISGFFKAWNAANTAATLVVQQNGAQTASLFEARNDGGTAMFGINSSGDISLAGRLTRNVAGTLSAAGAGGQASEEITLTGVVPGDPCIVGHTNPNSGTLLISALATANDKVTISVRNNSGSAWDSSTGNFKIACFKIP